MKQFKIPVIYSMTGNVIIEAESEDDLLNKLRSGILDTTPQQIQPTYLKDSVQIDIDETITDLETGSEVKF
jgi:hypothetical protein